MLPRILHPTWIGNNRANPDWEQYGIVLMKWGFCPKSKDRNPAARMSEVVGTELWKSPPLLLECRTRQNFRRRNFDELDLCAAPGKPQRGLEEDVGAAGGQRRSVSSLSHHG